MSLFTRPVIVGLIICSNCCLLQRSKTCKGGYCIAGMAGWGPGADGGWWERWAWRVWGLCGLVVFVHSLVSCSHPRWSRVC